MKIIGVCQLQAISGNLKHQSQMNTDKNKTRSFTADVIRVSRVERRLHRF
jgi:hypothetical protein